MDFVFFFSHRRLVNNDLSNVAVDTFKLFISEMKTIFSLHEERFNVDVQWAALNDQ